MQILLAALGCLLTTAYWPDIMGAATSTRWIVFGLSPLLLFYPHALKASAAHWVGSAFVLWALLTYAWSSSPQDTIGAGFHLVLIATVFCLGSLCRDLRTVYIGVAVGLIPSAVIAIAQYCGWQGLQEIASPSGLFVNRNFYAEISALCAVALIAERLWWWLPAATPGLLLTGARGALLAFAVAVIVMILRQRRYALALLAALALALIAFSALHKGDTSLLYRLDFWRGAFLHITAFGNGLGTYAEAVPRLGSMLAEHPHNEFLEYAFETGIVGIVLVTIFAGLLFRRPIGTETFVLIAFGVEAFFEFPSHQPATAFLGACCAGVLGSRIPHSLGKTWDGRIRIFQRGLRVGLRQVLSPLYRGARSLSLRRTFSRSDRSGTPYREEIRCHSCP